MKIRIFNRAILVVCIVISSFRMSPTVVGQNVGFEWVAVFEGLYNNFGNCIGVDTLGNIYTMGSYIDTTDFDPGPDAFFLQCPEYNNYFISKMDSSMNFVWAERLAGTFSFYYGKPILISPSGTVLITGYFDSALDFDPGADSFYMTPVGTQSIFISKLDPQGDFLWAKQLGGDGCVWGNTIKTDINGNILICGQFQGSMDIDPGPDTCELTSAGDYDCFVCKLDANGNFRWAKRFGGDNRDNIPSFDIDPEGSIYLTGTFASSVDFDPGPAIEILDCAGGSDAFISKLDSNGNFVWAKSIGGDLYNYGYGISLDQNSNIYLTGSYTGQVDFDPGPGSMVLTAGGDYWAFICKLDSSANFLWAKGMGSFAYTEGYSITTDITGNPYITGYFTETMDFDPGPGNFNITATGFVDPFICKLNTSGSFEWAAHIAGSSDDRVSSLALDFNNNVYVTGEFKETADFNPGPGIQNISTNGSYNTYILKLRQLEAPSGFNNVKITEDFNVNPNPSSGLFKLTLQRDLSNEVIIVRNTLGQLVWEQRNAFGKRFMIDLSNQPKGVYYIGILGDGFVEVKPIIKL